MGRSAIVFGFIVASGISAAVIGSRLYAAENDQLHAGNHKEVYVSPGADKKNLFNEPFRGAEGQQVTIDHYSLPPAWIGGRHYHTGPVYVYILEGVLTVDEQGKPRQTFNAGEVYPEPVGIPMQTRNLSTSDPMKLLVIQITAKGEPLMYKAE
jgi:quercetin dioxygenase-like cupin family protein